MQQNIALVRHTSFHVIVIIDCTSVGNKMFGFILVVNASALYTAYRSYTESADCNSRSTEL
jgi:hypothetical protein